jgi:hypothetical protein
MGIFENPDLRASAARIVCLNHFASIAALRRKVGFDQPKSYLTPKPRVLVCTSIIWVVANIFFKQPLRGLFAFLFARVAYDSVRTASIPQYQPRVQLAGHWIAGLWCNRKLDADCPPVVLDHSGSVFLRGTFRRTLNF